MSCFGTMSCRSLAFSAMRTISSAKQRLDITWPGIWAPMDVSWITYIIAILRSRLKSWGEMTHPWRTLTVVLNQSVSSPLTRSTICDLLYRDQSKRTSFSNHVFDITLECFLVWYGAPRYTNPVTWCQLVSINGMLFLLMVCNFFFFFWDVNLKPKIWAALEL